MLYSRIVGARLSAHMRRSVGKFYEKYPATARRPASAKTALRRLGYAARKQKVANLGDIAEIASAYRSMEQLALHGLQQVPEEHLRGAWQEQSEQSVVVETSQPVGETTTGNRRAAGNTVFGLPQLAEQVGVYLRQPRCPGATAVTSVTQRLRLLAGAQPSSAQKVGDTADARGSECRARGGQERGTRMAGRDPE